LFGICNNGNIELTMKIALAVAVGLTLGACTPRDSSSPPKAPPLTVFAAASLKELVSDISTQWTKETSQEVRLEFEASSTLGRQISEGALADVFISAAPEWVDQVKPKERLDWLSNRLVLVVPNGARDADPKALESLALADEQVPAGKYARAALSALGARLPGRTIYGSNVRDVLSKVSQGGAQAGIVYATDAPIDPGVRVCYTFPPESHPRILYVAGLLSPAGKGYFQALQAPWAKEIARRHGFVDLK
jgi:molybdate transport system substrate-binding protein